MRRASDLTKYHTLHKTRAEVPDLGPVTLTVKPGLRSLHPGIGLLLERADLSANHLIDVTGSAGLAAIAATLRDSAKAVTILEPSRAALRCLTETLMKFPNICATAGLPWDAPESSADLCCLAPTTDHGTARVMAELRGTHAALENGGFAYLMMHRDQGAKRYEKQARQMFGELEVAGREKGWRLSRAIKRNTRTQKVEPIVFSAAGLKLESEPGVFATGKLDSGTALLLEAMSAIDFSDKRVLDLGCGYGILSLRAALSDAEVVAVDDDLAAVRSTRDNALRHDLKLCCLHSDVDYELGSEEFDLVLTNPPFHVGRQVRAEVPEAFLAASRECLRADGELWLVANRALLYERELESWAEIEQIAANERYKVLRAIKR